MLLQDVHFSVGLSLADRGIDCGRAEVEYTTEQDAHGGLVVDRSGGGRDGGGREGDGMGVVDTCIFFTLRKRKRGRREGRQKKGERERERERERGREKRKT